MQDLKDSEIIEQIKDSKTYDIGFRNLVNTYQERIYWAVRKMVIDHEDANDVTQEVFIKIYKYLKNFREDAKLYTWVYRIAVNESLTFLNKKKRQSIASIDGEEHSHLIDSLSSSTHIDGNEVEMKLQKALLTLPDKQRLVFNLKYFDDLKYNEISEITETSVGSLKASYHHAVNKIEEFINSN